MTSNKRRRRSSESSRRSSNKQSPRTANDKHESVTRADNYSKLFENGNSNLGVFFPRSHELADLDMARDIANEILESQNCKNEIINKFDNLMIEEEHWKSEESATELAALSLALLSFPRDEIAACCKRKNITIEYENEYFGGVVFDENQQRLHALHLARNATVDLAEDENCIVCIGTEMTVHRVSKPDALLYYDVMTDTIDEAIANNDALCKIGKTKLHNLHVRPYQEETYRSRSDDDTLIYEGGKVLNLLYIVVKPGLSSSIEGFGALWLRWTHVGVNERMERWEGSLNDDASAHSPVACYFRTVNRNSIGKNIVKFFEKIKEKKRTARGQPRKKQPKPQNRPSDFQLTSCFDINLPLRFQSKILMFSPITDITQRQKDLDECLSYIDLQTSLILFCGMELPVTTDSLVELCASLNALINEYELSIGKFEPKEFLPNHNSQLNELHTDCSLMALMVLTPGRNSPSGGTVCDTFFGHVIAIRLLKTDKITSEMMDENPLLARIYRFTQLQRKYYNDNDYHRGRRKYSMVASPDSFEAEVLEHVGFEFDLETHKEDTLMNVRENFVNNIRNRDDNNESANASSLFASMFGGPK